MENTTLPGNTPDNKNLDQLRFELDRYKTKRELALRKQEIRQKKSDVRWPLWIAIVGALVTLAGGIITLGSNVWVTHQNNLANEKLASERAKTDERLARQKFESDLVLEVVKTGNLQSAHNNLRFLLEAGFLTDPDHKLRAALARKDLVPLALPSISKPFVPSGGTIKEFVLKAVDETGHPIPGATVSCDGEEHTTKPDGQVTCILPAGAQSVAVDAKAPDGSTYSERIPTTQRVIRLKKPDER